MRKIAFTQFLIFFLATGAIGEEIDYSKIAEAKSARYSNLVIRYIRIYGEPCAILQTLNPKIDWEITSTKTICSLNEKSFKADFSDAHFEEVYFSENSVHLTLSITPLEPTGEQKKECIIPVKDGVISVMTCEDIPKPSLE